MPKELLVLLVNEIFRNSVWIGLGIGLILLRNVCISLYLDLNNAFKYRRLAFYCGGGLEMVVVVVKLRCFFSSQYARCIFLSVEPQLIMISLNAIKLSGG